ncbi:MAG TPA: CBS domain-containing protein [Acidimicrobiia bacterium]|nr:CBS domain-containing protein [Acidimicrobiia bacterium]
MPERVSEVMTPNPVTLDDTADLFTAAQAMRDNDIGDVIVTGSDGKPCGIVTDRDLVVRGMAEGLDAASATLDDLCNHRLVTVGADDSIASVVKTMEESAIRRLPVMENGDLVGIVSIGDLAVQRDPKSALGEISAAPPNN